MGRLQDIAIHPSNPYRLALLDENTRDRPFTEAAHLLRERLGQRRIWHVNSTAVGGGVAEMLSPLLGYAAGLGIDVRWEVIGGDDAFFRITMRLHNRIHGSMGDGGALGEAERRHYVRITAENAVELAKRVRPGDIVVLHDPQTAGLVMPMKERGCVVVWRSHIGQARRGDERDVIAGEAWDFLRDFLEGADAYCFTMADFAPAWIDRRKLAVIPPSIDPFSPKNEDLAAETVRAILAQTGIIAGDPGPAGARRAAIVREGPAPSPEAPLVVQVSRWDRLKDMPGVLQGFAAKVTPESEAHLVLAGPPVHGVRDAPEQAEIHASCVELWKRQSPLVRARTQIVCLPMDDPDENALMVNALQRHAAVVVQKSLEEGFGLTVTEALWKGRAVLASAVGGIPTQIHDGVDGVLLQDPRDLETFGTLLFGLLGDPERRARLGTAARKTVERSFLGTRHLRQYGALLTQLLAGKAAESEVGIDGRNAQRQGEEHEAHVKWRSESSPR